MMVPVVSVVVVALLLWLAVWTVVARDAFLAVAAFVVYGLLLALVWVRLAGVDVALTEAAIGGGLTGALLLGAVGRLRRTEAATTSEGASIATRILAALLALSVTAALMVAVLMLPEPPPSLAPMVVPAMPATGVGNPITGVLLAFRALDTLLEAIVLVIALIGVWSIAPDRAWGGRPGLRYHADPNGILAYLARVLPPLGIVIGIYLFWAGADHPGGKFQGATILAAMWMLVQMAALADAPRTDAASLRAGIAIGPLVFIAVGTLGLWTGGTFLGYPAGWAKPLILTIEIALLPTLVLVLALLMNGPPSRRAVP
ncbi:MAG TPA: hydrogenase subunit MbhD domain-containing protein [Burkholderiaceae bacterium]|nr:hydrogenase subunit MbhD domain-containing protein [Burkholderiaceae bacterium]